MHARLCRRLFFAMPFTKTDNDIAKDLHWKMQVNKKKDKANKWQCQQNLLNLTDKLAINVKKWHSSKLKPYEL